MRTLTTKGLNATRTASLLGAAALLTAAFAAGPAEAGSQFKKFWQGQLVEKSVATSVAMADETGREAARQPHNYRSGPDYWGVGVNADRR